MINRGHQRKGDFSGSALLRKFSETTGQFPERFLREDPPAYVLMPNHYHLQLELGSRLSLSAAMHWLNTGYGIWFNRRYRPQGGLFQVRYKAILFDPDDCLLAVHYRIHLNPVRVGILNAVEAEEGTLDKTLVRLGRTPERSR